VIVRDATPADHPHIAEIVHAAFVAAFGRSDEGALIAALRSNGDVLRERVALDGDAIVGHILFSRAWIEGDGASAPAVQLAPVSAAPQTQRRGIGSRLIVDGLDALARAGETHVFVLGHPAYYPRFGFFAEAAARFQSPWPGPNFMLKRLSEGGPEDGRLRVSAAFA
jgi:putative acetyltransferase